MYHNKQEPLGNMQPGDEGIISAILAKGKIKQRLLEMGFIKGAHLKIERSAPLGDPIELVIKGYHIILRRKEGNCILISKVA